MNYNLPHVSVLLPVHNGAKYISDAIESILNQTYENFEFIIVEDASTDESKEIIRSYQDKRIKLVENEINLGQASSMNIGLNISSGKYIARIDQDDISLPTRLQKQVEFMENNIEVGVCGTWMEYIGKLSGILRLETEDSAIKIKLLRDTELSHPTVMIRKSILNEHSLRYDSSFSPAEDYCLWTQLSKHCKLGNIGEVLIQYRIHDLQGSGKDDINNLNQKNSDRIRKRLIRNLGIEPSSQDIKIHNDVFFSKNIKRKYLIEYHNWLLRLISGNVNNNIYNHKEFVDVLKVKWSYIVNEVSDIDFRMLLIIFSSPLREGALSFIEFIKLYKKSLRKWHIISKIVLILK